MKVLTKLLATCVAVLALGVAATGCKEKTEADKMAEAAKDAADKTAAATKDAAQKAEGAAKDALKKVEEAAKK